jgi:hypothetical protein
VRIIKKNSKKSNNHLKDFEKKKKNFVSSMIRAMLFVIDVGTVFYIVEDKK